MLANIYNIVCVCVFKYFFHKNNIQKISKLI